MTQARRVLILDDDEGVRFTFAHALALEGYSVQVAETASQALREIRRARPDAILVDFKMPLINGVGFLYRLREDPTNREIAVGVITGELEVDDATAHDLAMLSARLWHKPLSIEELQEVVRTLLTPKPS
jgi:two-component system response regulator (stage 0 sporulation protein F)